VLRGRGAEAAAAGRLLLGVQRVPVVVPDQGGDGRRRAERALPVRDVPAAGAAFSSRDRGGSDVMTEAAA
jgi:hypothetical protein